MYDPMPASWIVDRLSRPYLMSTPIITVLTDSFRIGVLWIVASKPFTVGDWLDLGLQMQGGRQHLGHIRILLGVLEMTLPLLLIVV